MPKKGYRQTDEHKRNGAEARKGNTNAKGCKHSEESKVKSGLAAIGNKYSVGKQYALGCTHSQESKDRVSRAMLGNKNGEGHTVSIEARQKLRMANLREKSHFWRDGRSATKYASGWGSIAKSIRLRDDGICVLCGQPEQLKRKPIVHHIDTHKKNNDPLNLVTVCMRCHRKIHATIDSEQDYEIILSNWIRQKYKTQDYMFRVK